LLTNIVDFIWPLGLALSILAFLGIGVWRGAQFERKENKKILTQFADLFESVPEQVVLANARKPDGGASGSLESAVGSASAIVLEAPNGLYVRFAWDSTYFLIPWSRVEEVSLLGKKRLKLTAAQQNGDSVSIQMPWAPTMTFDGWREDRESPE